MRERAFKLDQNVPERVAHQLRRHGFDAMTILEQDMVGAPDSVVHSVCQKEDRVLVTFDLDFADIREYPPSESCGLIVLRPPSQDAPTVVKLIERLIPRLQSLDPRGELWIVEDSRIRIRGGTR